MKNYFFQKGLFASLLLCCSQLFAQNSIVITYPLNNSVFQQSSSGNSPISFAGQILKGSFLPTEIINTRIALRIEKYNYIAKQWGLHNTIPMAPILVINDCTNCNSSLEFDGKSFYLKGGPASTTFSLGWYRATVVEILPIQAFQCNFNYIPKPLSPSITFGVGDVYMIAGQSNASGFTRNEDEDLMYYESTSFDGQPKITDSEIPEGSIVNRITTSGRAEILRMVGGLSIMPSGSNKGLVKFISGKFSTGDEMGIAPNGYDSWAWCRFAKDIVTAKSYPVLLFNTAVPNTSIVQWNNTLFDSHLKKTLQMYGGAFGAKAILWQQGENETEIKRQIPNSYSLTTNYETPFGQLIDKSRNQAISNIPWVISQTSYNVSVPTATGTGLISSSLTLTSSNGYLFKNFYSDLISKQNTILGTKSFLYSGPLTEPIAGVGTGDLDERYRGPGQRRHFDGVQGVGGKNGLELLAEKWYNSVFSLPNTANTVAKLPNRIIVSKSGSQYLLTLTDPNVLPNSDGSPVILTTGNFYWVVNDGGISAKITDPNQVPNAYTYKIPTSVSQDYYVTCYYQNNTNQVLTPSQPYLVKATCAGCRIGSGSSTVVSLLRRNVPAAGNTENISYSNIKDSFNGRIRDCIPTWITISMNTNNNLTLVTEPNTTAAARSASIVIEDNSGVAYLTIPITQAAATSSCIATSLLSRPVGTTTGTWTANVTTINTTPIVNGTTFINGGTNGSLSALSNCSRRYNLGGGYVTFTGKVGRDDSQDLCSCYSSPGSNPPIGMDMGFQIINLDNNTILFNSSIHGVNSPAQPFSVNVSGVQNIELRTLPGADGYNWGDLGNWVELSLHCGTPPVCSVQNPSNPTSNLNNVAPGTSVTLSSSCPVGTPAWSTGGTTNSIVVAPAVTTTYSILCNNGANCASSSFSITVNVVAAGACSALSNGLVMGTWSVTGNQLVARNFGGQYWLTQRVTANPEVFAVRASQMLQRGDVTLTNTTYSNLVGCFAYQYSDYGGLATPTSSQFPTPAGFTLGSYSDTTPIYTQNSSNGGNTPNYQGFLDWTDCGGIYGWAWDQANQNDRKTIEISTTTGTILGTVIANEYRADLAAAGFNDGFYKFTFPTPNSLKNGGTYSITAKINGTSYILNTTPKTISGCLAMNARVSADAIINNEESIEGLVVSPNPSDGIYSLSFSTVAGSRVALMVTNLGGSVVLKQDFQAVSGNVNHVINLKGKPDGEYLVTVVFGNKKLTKKVIKIE